MSTKKSYPTVTPVSAALSASCPRCGNGRLFSGYLKPAKSCMSCGLDFGFVDPGDGPAVFVILIVGFVVLGLGLMVESAFAPPLWVHGVLGIILILALSLWGLRFGKALLIAIQYRTGARQGEME
ncbi:MAG: DUF983 domain-containing protein [Rhizobiaceae bacterium]